MAVRSKEAEELRAVMLKYRNEQLVKRIDAQYGDKGGGQPPPIPDALILDMGTELLQSEHTLSSAVCANSIDREGLWASDDPQHLNTLVNPDTAFCNRLAQLCWEARVQRCGRSICCRRRELMDLIVPRCRWSAFRDWAITAMACQALFTPVERRRRAFTHLVMIATLCHRLLADYTMDSKPLEDTLVGHHRQYSIDLASVAEVIYWMLTIQNAYQTGNIIEGKWGPNFLPKNLVRDGVNKSLEAAEDLGLCKNRLWKLMGVMERKEIDLPGLLEQARRHPSSFGQDGKNCQPNKCPFNTLDTTQMQQLHKIKGPHDCPKVVYPVRLLEESVSKGTGSVWSRHEIKPIVGLGVRYAAISHVWLDGTGIGIGDRTGIGIVNKCLSDFFIGIAARLDCDGIWWDTISLPTNDALRKKCIDNMHENYRQAECTILHDNFLVNFDWTDDGSPCVALVLSSWFTRGWTALELHESQRVKVLFKGSNPLEPRIKDLDDDILAKHPATATRAHWIATCIIQRMRRRSASRGWDLPIENMRDLLAIIQPRSVCRIEDKTTIAGLLADLPPTDCYQCNEVPTDDSSKERIKTHLKIHTTERVLRRLPKLGHASLMHGKLTLRESGPFSWASAAVYDMPVETAGDLEDGALSELSLTVDTLGGVTGSWYFRGLSAEECEAGAIMPKEGSDPATVSRVAEALHNRPACVLLREGRNTKPWMLVMAVGWGEHMKDGRVQKVVDCRYVGAVKVSWLWEAATEGRGRYRYQGFRLGHDGTRAVVDARELLPEIIEGGYRAPLSRDPLEDGGEGELKGSEEEFGKENEQEEQEDPEEEEEEEEGDDDSVEIPSDSEREWYSSDSNGPARPKW